MLAKKIEEKIKEFVILFVNACILSCFAWLVFFPHILDLHSFMNIANALIFWKWKYDKWKYMWSVYEWWNGKKIWNKPQSLNWKESQPKKWFFFACLKNNVEVRWYEFFMLGFFLCEW
jgi:hypothetical protein